MTNKTLQNKVDKILNDNTSLYIKRMRLISLAFKLIPQSPQQLMVREYISDVMREEQMIVDYNNGNYHKCH